MNKTNVLAKALATGGLLLVRFPVVATVVAAGAGSIRDRVFRVDCLMPAELSPLVSAGGGLLSWAALRVRSRQGLIGCGLGLALGLLVGGRVLAVATELATGESESAGWPRVVALASLAAYTRAPEVSIVGAVLVRDVFQHGDNRVP